MRSAASCGQLLAIRFSSSKSAFQTQLRHELPAWVLVTSHCLREDGLVFHRIRQQHPCCHIIFCALDNTCPSLGGLDTASPSYPDVLCTVHELTECLVAAAKDSFFVSASLAALYGPLPTEPAATRIALTAISRAEKRVLRQLLLGKSSKQIAEALFLSPRTVENHKASMADKLHVRAEAGSLAAFLLRHREALLHLLDQDIQLPIE
ncbi:response regulator transcription factor [Hymenobacter lutimineralis]